MLANNRRWWIPLAAAVACVVGHAGAGERLTFARDLALSPDGRTLAFTWAGDIWIVSSEGGQAQRLTVHPARDWQVIWSPDAKALCFVSDREGQEVIYRATSAEPPPRPLSDSLRFTIERVTDNPQTETAPQISLGGKTLALIRGRGDVVLRDLYAAAHGKGGLNDGSFIRQPFRGWYTLPDKVDLELHGAKPDVEVPLTPGDEQAGRHPQLDAAIKATLEQLDSSKVNKADAP